MWIMYTSTGTARAIRPAHAITGREEMERLPARLPTKP
jgi:hypothetical protein